MTFYVACRGDVADLEDGEILTAVKLEPRTSEDEDMQACRTAAVSRRPNRRFCSSTEPRHNLRHVSNDGRRRGVDYDDDVSGVPVSGDGSSPVTRNKKQRRSSKGTTSSGQPGLLCRNVDWHGILCKRKGYL